MKKLVERTLVVVLKLNAQPKHDGISLARLVAKQEFLVANERVDCFHVSTSHVVHLILRVKSKATHPRTEKHSKAEIPVS